ncbi:hypothetical protein QEN19_002710 [Hanseniaspora menglaensis]
MLFYNSQSGSTPQPEFPPIFNDEPNATVVSLIVMTVSMGITVLLLLLVAVILLNMRDEDDEIVNTGNAELERQPLLDQNEGDTNKYGGFSIFNLFNSNSSKKGGKSNSKTKKLTQEEEANVICNNFIIEKGFVGSNIFPNYNVLGHHKHTVEHYLHDQNIDLITNKYARESYGNILLKQMTDSELEIFEDDLFTNGTFQDIETYSRSKLFQQENPPFVKKFGTMNNLKLRQRVQYRGLQSYQFLPSINDKVDASSNAFLPSYIINDKLNVLFTNINESSSTIMNLPMPKNSKECSYFECKVYMNEQQKVDNAFSIGLVTIPYPYYRIPGYNSLSIGYESNGNLRINNYVTEGVLPQLHNGDVVGFGYRYKSGLIFITYNGKKTLDIPNKHAIELFVSCGLKGQNNSLVLQFNIGQIGYLFIEANVRKYAFDSNLEGTVGVPPSYQNKEKDRLLLKTDISELNMDAEKDESLPPQYN